MINLVLQTLAFAFLVALVGSVLIAGIIGVLRALIWMIEP